MANKLRTAIIGCGGIANGKHMPALRATKVCDMVAFCDIIEERAIAAKNAYGTADSKVYTDYNELLKDKSIDVVHVCTPNSSHAPITIAALHADKHVLCEKPMAKTAAEAKAMLDAANETGKKLSIGYQNRYTPESLYMKRVAEAGELGEAYYAKAYALRRRGVPTWGVFMDEEKQGGGPLIDIGTHALDLTLWVMNNHKPKYVVGTTYNKLAKQTDTGNAFGDWNPDDFTVEDSAFGFIVMEDGSTVILESSWALNTLEGGEAKCAISGTLAGIDNRNGPVRINKVKHGRLTVESPDLGAGGVAFFEGMSSNPTEIEQSVFYRSITDGTPLTVLPEEALVVSQILEGIYVSAKTGKPYYF